MPSWWPPVVALSQARACKPVPAPSAPGRCRTGPHNCSWRGRERAAGGRSPCGSTADSCKADGERMPVGAGPPGPQRRGNPWQRMQPPAIRYNSLGEHGLGATDARQLVLSWLADPPHRANVLGPGGRGIWQGRLVLGRRLRTTWGNSGSHRCHGPSLNCRGGRGNSLPGVGRAAGVDVEDIGNVDRPVPVTILAEGRCIVTKEMNVSRQHAIIAGRSCQGRCHKYKRWPIIGGELLVAFQLTITQECKVTTKIVDAKGNPAQVDGIPAWLTDNPNVVALTPSSDGLSCLVAAVGPIGTATVSMTADADLGAGTETLVGIPVIAAGPAQAITLTPGPATEQS